jgi:parvulin-like peptidyl-prolyl isomerase
MEQEDHKEQTSAFSDFLGALGLSGGRKTQPETKIPEPPQTPEPAAEAPEPTPQEDVAETPESPPEPEASGTPEGDKPTEPESAPRWVIAEPIHKHKAPRKAIIAAIALLAVLCALWYFWPLLAEPIPPGEDVVAAFNNRYITISDLKDFIVLESGGREDIEISSLEQYRQIIRIMAVEQIVQTRAAQKGIEERDEVRHNLQDLINDASIDTLVHQIAQRELSEEAIPKYEVQQYYDNNRGQYGEKNFSDVEHEIREILVRAKEQDFFPQYIEELKSATGLEVNFELLDTLGTSEESMAEAVSLRGDEALFNVHGRRYTLKNFYTEFRELPAMYQERFSTHEARRQLLEQFVAKELLLEETGDASENEVEQHSLEELKAQYLTQLLHQEEVEARITEPEETEILAFYEKNKKNFVIPARVRISLIWISEGENGENREQARQKAREALAALQSGTEFAEAAKLYSEDYSAGAGGEIMQWVVQSHLPRDLGKAIFALKAGETSGVITSQNALYIVKINERVEEEQMTYDDAKETIITYLKEEQHNKLQQEMETALFKEAGFIVYNRTLRKLLKGQL